MMRKTLWFLFTIWSCIAFAQVPQGMSYQAVAFDSSGNPVTNGNVSVRISIFDNSITGTLIYAETHTALTNAQGLFNLNIGQGSPLTGNFPTINWGVNTKFLKVEVDPSGGTNYTNVGTNQLMSVPYALFAERANESISPDTIVNTVVIDSIVNTVFIDTVVNTIVIDTVLNQTIVIDTIFNDLNSQIADAKSANFAINDIVENKMHVFNALTNTWTSQTYNDISSVVRQGNGNFLINDIADDIFYAFHALTNTWIPQTYNNASSVVRVDTIRGNFLVNDISDNIAYAFSSKTATWVGQSYTDISSVVRESKGNFMINDIVENIVHVFDASTEQWISQTYNDISSVVVLGNGNFLIIDISDKIAYAFNAKTGTWSGQAYTDISSVIRISRIE